MKKISNWISAARPRTLPLSIAGILTGTAVAVQQGLFDTSIFIWAILTTLALQVLSNFANDYGDGVKGTDNQDRVGPMRALQSGNITDKQMKKGIVVTVLLCIAFAVILIYNAFGKENLLLSLLFLGLGIAAIAAAIKYTVGKNAYGYRGLGDLFVFIFFGLLSVVGSYFLFSVQLNAFIFLPAIGIGLLSSAVLNLNNMRDRISDQKSNKNTLVVLMGDKNARIYHSFLIIVALLCFFIFILLSDLAPIFYTCFIAFIPLFIHLRTVFKTNHPKDLDPELKKVALSTFALSLIFLLISWI
ncbi:MAG: 1,4-dihydroxy-2-naphthoate octaprenyltransferase [Bacteroidota bacterium]